MILWKIQSSLYSNRKSLIKFMIIINNKILSKKIVWFEDQLTKQYVFNKIYKLKYNFYWNDINFTIKIEVNFKVRLKILHQYNLVYLQDFVNCYLKWNKLQSWDLVTIIELSTLL